MSKPIIGNTTATPYPRPDWNQIDDKKADFINNKPSFQQGEGINSIQQPTTTAFSDNAIALGVDTKAGVKGFYITAIDLKNRRIWLYHEKTDSLYEGDYSSRSEDPVDWTIPYAVNDVFSIIVKDTNINHYHFCGAIESINGNIITYKKDTPLPFDGVVADQTADYTPAFIVPAKPDLGEVTFSFIGQYAEGNQTISAGKYSHAEGYNNISAGSYSHTEGRDNKASYAAHAEGEGTMARGYSAHSEGQSTQALGKRAHAEGYFTIADGENSHAEGRGTHATGINSHAEGIGSKAQGSGSHSEGGNTVANNDYSHAEGLETYALAQAAHAEGDKTQAKAQGAHSEGINTRALNLASHAEGQDSWAQGNRAHAEGYSTKANAANSHAEGGSTIADGGNSHAEGQGTHAKAYASHAEGEQTKAYGDGSHAEGQATEALGKHAHSEGFATKAKSDNAHTEGYYTVAEGDNQHVEGRWNIPLGSEYVHIVGNGTNSDNLSNAHTLDWNGNAWFAGDVSVGANSDKLITKKEVETKINSLINGAPEKLNTLNELAAALNDNPSFANNVLTELSKKINAEDLSKVATSGEYNDLNNKPFIETEYYGISRDNSALLTLAAIKQLIGYEVPIVFCSSNPINMDLTQTNGATAYFYVSKNTPNDSVFLFQQWTEKWYEEEQDKLSTYTQTIIDSSGVRVREKVVSAFGVIPTTDKWEWKPLNDYTPTKDYIDSVISDLSYHDLQGAPQLPDSLIVPDGELSLMGIPQFSEVAFSGSYNDLKNIPEIPEMPELADVATSGKYNDLINKPITVLNYYPTNQQLEQMGEGIYLAKVNDFTFPDYMYFFSSYEDFEIECPVCGKGYSYGDKICSNCLTEIASLQNKGVEHKHQSWTTTIISNNGVRVERKDNYRNFLDGRENYTIDWREVPLNENTATKDDIGDVEKALDEIIDEFNLDTSITLEISESSTHSEKPTALAVKNYVDNAIGDALEGSY